jgi:ferritin-like metal-binding protein YciE
MTVRGCSAGRAGIATPQGGGSHPIVRFARFGNGGVGEAGTNRGGHELQARDVQPRDLKPKVNRMTDKTLSDLFLSQLKDIYYAEKQIYKTLPKMAKATKLAPLKEAFTHHREQTQEQIARIEQVFEALGKRPQGKTCEAINGIIEEGAETIEDFGGSPVIDTGLIAAGEAVEHYEMARYGALVAWAKQLGLKDAADLLNQNWQEEIQAQQLLAKIGMETADKKAA